MSEEKQVSPEYIRQRIKEKREKRNRNAIAHLYGEKVKRPRVRKKKPKLETAPSDALALAKRVANLNPDAGEIGEGMLRSLVEDARRIVG